MRFALLLRVVVVVAAMVGTTQAVNAPSQYDEPGVENPPGLRLFTEQVDFGAGPAEVNILQVDLRRRRVVPVLAGGGVPGLATVPETAQAEHAIAAINGDYWRGGQPANQGDPVSLYIEGHNVVSRPITGLSRGLLVGQSSKITLHQGVTEFALDLRLGGTRVAVPVSSQELNSVDKVNPSGKLNKLALFTSAYGGRVPIAENAYLLLVEDIIPDDILRPNRTYTGKVTRILPPGTSFSVSAKSVVIAFYEREQEQLPSALRKVGAAVSLTIRLPQSANLWEWSCGGYPTLVHEGVANSFTGWHDPGVVSVHPRTAVGLDQIGQYLYLITVDGRYPGEKPGGTDLAALARYLVKRWKLYAALNLDGGGSTTMTVYRDKQYQVLNRPSDGRPRRVAQSILVF